MLLFWKDSFAYERVLFWSSCPPCSFLSLLHDERLFRFLWQFSISVVDIASGSHGIPNSSFPSKHSSDKINFFIATWTKVVERVFFLPDSVLGTAKNKEHSIFYIWLKYVRCRIKYYMWKKNVRCTIYLSCAGIHALFNSLLYSGVVFLIGKLVTALKIDSVQNDVQS